ncbi:MAG: DUF481 domain-containing protein [Xanthomonadaceae bacterium]|nr:DUF481 domain-containing protein [Xanthomonadaceae bacterium]
MSVKPMACPLLPRAALLLSLMAGSGLAIADDEPAPAPEAGPEASTEASAEIRTEAGAEAPAAEVPAPAAKSPWLGDLAIGVVNTSGNTRTRSVNVRGALEYRRSRWGNRFSALAFSGTRDGLTTDERYSAANKTDLQFDERNYAYTNIAYDNDRFAGVAERYAVTLGYGRHLLTGPVHTLDIETGVGANRTRDQDDLYETAAIATFGGKYIWAISPNAEFSQTLRTEAGKTNIYVNPISALKLTIVGNLFATFNHEIRYNSQVPDGLRHVDQISTINLGYTFGTP